MRVLNIVGPRTLRHELEAKVERHPNRSWLIFEARDGSVQHVTYGEFARRACQAAAVLTELGIRPGADHAAPEQLPRVPGVVVGAALCGAVVVPVNTLSSLDELAYLVNHSESVLVVTEPTLLPIVEGCCHAARTCGTCSSAAPPRTRDAPWPTNGSRGCARMTGRRTGPARSTRWRSSTHLARPAAPKAV